MWPFNLKFSLSDSPPWSRRARAVCHSWATCNWLLKLLDTITVNHWNAAEHSHENMQCAVKSCFAYCSSLTLTHILFFIVKCGIVRFLCAVCVFKVRASSSSPRLPCGKFRLFPGLHCWASPWRKIAYSTTQSINHSPNLFDVPQTEVLLRISEGANWISHMMRRKIKRTQIFPFLPLYPLHIFPSSALPSSFLPFFPSVLRCKAP